MRRGHDGDGVFYGISLQEVHRNLCTAQSDLLVHTLMVACGRAYISCGKSTDILVHTLDSENKDVRRR
jgi:hypothetical protein